MAASVDARARGFDFVVRGERGEQGKPGILLRSLVARAEGRGLVSEPRAKALVYKLPVSQSAGRVLTGWDHQCNVLVAGKECNMWTEGFG